MAQNERGFCELTGHVKFTPQVASQCISGHSTR